MTKKIITHFCSPEVQNKIFELYNSLAPNRFPFDFELIQSIRLTELTDSDCLFFVTTDDSSIDDVRNLLNRKTPKKRQIVIVSSDKNNYFDLAFEYGISNIISIKNLREPIFSGILRSVFQNTDQQNSRLGGYILDPFFPRALTLDKHHTLSGKVEPNSLIKKAFSDSIEQLNQSVRYTFMINCHELISNALAYGVRGITPHDRDVNIAQLGSEVEIPAGKEIQVRIIADSDNYGISVKDFGGTLTKNRILDKIRRQSVGIGETVQLGLEDFTGRGLIILSKHGLLLFSLKPKISTEVALICSAREIPKIANFSILTIEDKW
ncbi:hypothetical protein AGMMS49938_15080 [Fibrobacterales bacterium]|nr:hypothetical protein AGMMS49938_15080 [Fibrobacterales bacterium]